MTILLTILGIVVGVVILAALGCGVVAAIADGFFKFLKGIFGVGFGCAKSCMSIILVFIVAFLVLLLMAKCD